MTIKKPWTTHDLAAMDDMLNRGLSYKAIGRTLGRTDKAVMAQRMRQGMLTSRYRVTAAAASERARIVEWLRHGPSDVIDIAAAIENKEHLK